MKNGRAFHTAPRLSGTRADFLFLITSSILEDQNSLAAAHSSSVQSQEINRQNRDKK